MPRERAGPSPAKNWPAPPMDHSLGGKDSAFSWKMGELILARIADGETVRAITADPRMPSYATMFRWVQVHPGFAARYRALRDELAAEHVARVAGREASRAFWGQHKAKVLGKRWWRRGRPSSYTSSVGRAICARLRRGATMSAINADPAFPSAKVVYRWMRTEPKFRAMVMEARAWWIGWLEFHRDNVAETALQDPWAFHSIKREVEQIEGRIGRQRAKYFRAAGR